MKNCFFFSGTTFEYINKCNLAQTATVFDAYRSKAQYRLCLKRSKGVGYRMLENGVLQFSAAEILQGKNLLLR